MAKRDIPHEKEHLFKTLMGLRRRVAESLEQTAHLERMKEELRAGEEKYRAAFEYTGTAMVVVEEDTTISMANHRSEEVTGYPSSEAGKHKWTEFVPPQDLPRMKEYHRQRRENPDAVPSEYEWKLIDKNGQLRDILMNVSMIPGTRKSLVSMIDITERKKAEERLRESEARFRDIAEFMPGIIAELDLDLNVTYLNRRGLSTFGYTDQEIQDGVNAIEVVHPDFHEKVRTDITNILSGDYGRQQEYRMLGKDGTSLWMIINTAPLRKEDRVLGFRACLVDITENQRAQERVRLSEARFRSIYDNSPIGITLFGRTGCFIDANRAFCRMFCLPESNWGSRETWALDDFVTLSNETWERLAAGESSHFESVLDFRSIEPHFPQQLPDQPVRYLDWHVTPLREDREDERVFLAQVQDITERKAAEEAAIKSARRAADRARRLAEGLRKEIIRLSSYHADIVTRSPLMKAIFDMLPEMADSDATVLVTGESGTGKELIARSLHELGSRKNNAFVAVNCGALPDNLLESELFGYKAGAFTDAKKDKAGKFSLAKGGTLFLDEIGDISPAMQVKLLRVLQEKVYEPLGATKSEEADVRVTAATNRDLAAMVNDGTFREDLYYRIKVLNVRLPPLRQRLCDIPLLCEHFISRFNTRYKKAVRGVSEEALNILASYEYPGNVRELENIIEHAFIFCKSDTIEPEHLPAELRRENEAQTRAKTFTGIKSFEELEKLYIESMLHETGGNKAEAARRLGIHKATLFRKLKQLNISGTKAKG
ncbi:MAG: PAS domain S-box protein [Chitinivibrionales bacterium]|nr:PAS domain S-box protein [Chitinivibrionales bacterium]MBD3356277.1 PAS domain S-box protein [Chitinivibrionales bacterium]